ncbi:MAG: hypothetical protein V4557_14015 [Bacteroidota bacterium]
MYRTFVKPTRNLYKSISLLLLGCFLLTACTKTDDPPLTPEQQVLQYLTGVGNRFWRIKEIYVNNIKTTLTTAQLDYNKTYTHYGYIETNTGVFSDSDGLIGNWELKGTGQIKETITNNPSGNVVIDLMINHLDANNMDVEYTKNGQTVRTVYFAY